MSAAMSEGATIASDSIPLRYRGLSYEDASREGARLIARAHETGNWHAITEHLVELKLVMRLAAHVAQPAQAS